MPSFNDIQVSTDDVRVEGTFNMDEERWYDECSFEASFSAYDSGSKMNQFRNDLYKFVDTWNAEHRGSND